ncbi:hypothetical protein C8R45DRAFT_932722 [Mycena sanguinolenta]|nr:hypothetical protein C8R45DRAFT_932722 [Mycena sanguinolenta]
MIRESRWRRIPSTFFISSTCHNLTCLLAWILIVKLASTYYRKLKRLLTDTGRYRELPFWRKGLKKVWMKKMPITIPPLSPKHTAQGMKPVPPVFFLEVKRQRTAPFWVHPLLRRLWGGYTIPSSGEEQQVEVSSNDIGVQSTFLEAMDEKIEMVGEFLAAFEGLKYRNERARRSSGWRKLFIRYRTKSGREKLRRRGEGEEVGVDSGRGRPARSDENT